MTDIPTRCDIAANALCKIAQGGNFAPLYTSDQAIEKAATMLREAGEQLHRAERVMFDMEMALVEARKPWWRKVREKWNP